MPRLIINLEEFSDELRHGGLAIGNFDAIHLGHAALIERLVAICRRNGGPAIVFTFDPPPAKILSPAFPAPPALTWIERRVEALGDLGVDAVIAYPTDRHLLDMTAGEFFRSIVVEKIAARAMVEGPNFMFGKDRGGNVDVLSRLCREHEIDLHIVSLRTNGQELISSTRVRTLIAEGQIELANRMLVRPYRLRGVVVRGAGRGRQLGFPTANLESIPVLVPAAGVYAGSVSIDGRNWPAAINIGTNPTFHELQTKVEIHAVGWNGPLYGMQLDIDLLARVRDVTRFDSRDSLVQQIAIDVAACTRIMAQLSRVG